ncbi:MAG: RNA polymerase sigma factor [Tannerella sp.]|jgi:RNA polymerase sigma-70 factor (ECF subfamily)|nr:RNA polymerase sigma factor [Tannerella sp.]
MERLPDNYYVEKIRNGETDGFAPLLERYSKQVFAMIVRIVENKEDAEELTQDVFMKVYRNLDAFKGESSFSTWLYRIAYNIAVSATRKKSNEVTAIDEEMMERVSDMAEDEFSDEDASAKRADYLNMALDKLPPDEKAIVLMHYRDERSMEEIAEITGLSATNVKTKIFRIRKKLWILIKKIEESEEI